MFRYLAIVSEAGGWRTEGVMRRITDRIRSKLPKMMEVFDTEGLRVFVAGHQGTPNQTYPLSGGGGVILGKIFRKDVVAYGFGSGVPADPDMDQFIVDTRGGYLVDRYWGRYVAFSRSSSNDEISVIRDPSGALPCYRVGYEGVHVFFSHVADCADLEVTRLSVNWECVSAFLVNPFLQSPFTGINEIDEVPPGTCCCVGKSGRVKIERLWDASMIAAAEPVEDFDDAVQLVRLTTSACVGAWAACYPRIIHRLSGGLDSSVVLACLTRAPTSPHVTCVTFADLSRDGDERPYARLSAASGGYELLELIDDPAAIRLEAALDVVKSPRPELFVSYVTHGPQQDELAKERGATAIFGGGGGDDVFFRSAGAYSLSDYLYTNRLSSDLFRIAFETALIERRSIWSVLRSALGERFRASRVADPFSSEGGIHRFVNPEVVETVKKENWFVESLQRSAALSPGKRCQVLGASTRFSYYTPLKGCEAAERVEPLTAQPLVELMLKIPTHILAYRGRDRALERAAFAPEVPREIVSRIAKGASGVLFTEVLRHNEAFVRELLLDGWLVKQGLLDRRAIEKFFAVPYTQSTPGLTTLIVDHLSLEIWLQDWMCARVGEARDLTAARRSVLG